MEMTVQVATLRKFYLILVSQRLKNQISKTTELAEDRTHVLEVDGIDWFIRENGTTCHTSGYELVRERKAAVVRRGDVFTLGVSCKNRAYDPNRDKIRFIFEFGECLGVCREEQGWCAYLVQGVYFSLSLCKPASLNKVI